MDCLWIKKGGGLFPADPVTEGLLAAIGQDQMVRTNEPHKPRNPGFHRLMMAGMQAIVENTYPRFADVETAMNWFKIQANMVDYIDVHEGRVVLIPQSVSFSAMDQIKFKEVSENWREIALKEFGIDLLEEKCPTL